MYEATIYGEKTTTKDGETKTRRSKAGTVRSKGKNVLAALDDLKTVIGKLPAEKQGKIVRIIVTPVDVDADSPAINL